MYAMKITKLALVGNKLPKEDSPPLLLLCRRGDSASFVSDFLAIFISSSSYFMSSVRAYVIV